MLVCMKVGLFRLTASVCLMRNLLAEELQSVIRLQTASGFMFVVRALTL